MAKLYPPTIAGVLPSFYKNEKGTAIITVPFSMNKIVKKAEVSCFSLRIKSASTDILYGEVRSEPHAWVSSDTTDSQVYFDISSLLHKFSIGSFYKAQLAYVDQNGLIGFYSTVAIIKFTTKPTVTIGNFDEAITNNNLTEYIGIYDNILDPSEKVYQYCFTLYDKNNTILETSGWKIHNSYEDTSLSSSIDKYQIRHSFQPDATYKVQYSILTNNNLVVDSPKYLVMESQTVDSELQANLHADLNYENAYISLKLVPWNSQAKEEPITGRFVLSRSSSQDNFSTWLPISEFKLIGQYCHAFSFKDYSIEQGIEYQYSLQQTNDYGIYSNRILTNVIKANFENIFLFDGKRQLKIQFNPKVSSFKTVMLENKKTTLGNKYPFIFRNGSVAYKEFPINGLISLLINDDNFSDIEYIEDPKTVKTDITDNNITSERLFKLEVLNWLNNGEVKLFKSPQEGNYIVRLMNVNFTPIDQISRMLHNFSCQAVEIAEYTPDNLIKYKLLNTDGMVIYQTRWESVDLHSKQLELKASNKSIYGYNLLNGHSSNHIKITDAIMGTTFDIEYKDGTTEEIMIGATGAYEVFVEKAITKMNLSTKSNSTAFVINPDNVLLRGIFTFSYQSLALNKFNTIKNIVTQDIPSQQFLNPNNNILSYYQNVRRNVSRIYYMHFQKMPLQEINSNNFALNQNLNGAVTNLVPSSDFLPSVIYEIQKIDEEGNLLRKYMRYYNGKLYEYPHYFFPNYYKDTVEILDAYTTYKDIDNGMYYRFKNDELIPFETNVELRHIDLDPYSIYYKRYYDKGKLTTAYYRYNGIQLIQITDAELKDLYKIDIYWGKNQNNYAGHLSVEDREQIHFDEISNVPEYIKIGPGVCVDIGLQVKNIYYTVEDDYCSETKANYQQDLKTYLTYQLNFILVTDKEEREHLSTWALEKGKIYYLWKDEKFVKINSLEELLVYEDNKDIEIYAHVDQGQSNIASANTLFTYYNNMIKSENAFIEDIDKKLHQQAEGLL